MGTDAGVRPHEHCNVKAVHLQASRAYIVLKCFDIFKHHRRPGTVDKIKKYCRDSPSGVFTDLGSVHPDGRGR